MVLHASPVALLVGVGCQLLVLSDFRVQGVLGSPPIDVIVILALLDITAHPLSVNEFVRVHVPGEFVVFGAFIHIVEPIKIRRVVLLPLPLVGDYDLLKLLVLLDGPDDALVHLREGLLQDLEHEVRVFQPLVRVLDYLLL